MQTNAKQQPQAPDAKPGAPGAKDTPPAPPKPGKFAKVAKAVLATVLVATAVSMWWHGKQLGEARAKAQGKPVTEASTLPPWSWTSDDWRSWYGNVETAVDSTANKVSDKAAALKKRLDDWQASRNAQPAAAQPGQPAQAAQATQDAGPPEGYDAAAKLVDDGKDAWTRHDYGTAKSKLVEAKSALGGMPKHPSVTKALELANDLLEDIEMNSPK